MKIIPYRKGRSYYPMMSFFDNFMDRFMDDEQDQVNQGTMPLDIIEEEDKFILEASLPGFRKEDIGIAIEDNELIIEAKRAERQEETKGNYCRCEIFRGNYRRVLSLSDIIDKDKVDAKYENGILSISVPKLDPKPATKISIS